MSEANREYVIKHNSEIDPKKVEICPNSIEVQDISISENEKAKIRETYEIPMDRTVFVYGGNLGKPQGIPFLMECLKAEKDNGQVYFLIIGDGTEYPVLEDFCKMEEFSNVRLIQRLPKEEFDRVVAACDVGMIFLDHQFTIPNFPSRLLSYMQAGIPVLACTDPNTDIGKVITDGGFGWWCESNDVKAFQNCMEEICNGCTEVRGMNGYHILESDYSSEMGYRIITNSKVIYS